MHADGKLTCTTGKACHLSVIGEHLAGTGDQCIAAQRRLELPVVFVGKRDGRSTAAADPHSSCGRKQKKYLAMHGHFLDNRSGPLRVAKGEDWMGEKGVIDVVLVMMSSSIDPVIIFLWSVSWEPILVMLRPHL